MHQVADAVPLYAHTESSSAVAGMQRQGLTADEACKNFWIADYRGLITAQREELSDAVAPFARTSGTGDKEGEALADLVRRVSADSPGCGCCCPLIKSCSSGNSVM
jgi:Malic enzyme, NAD binding domain